MLKNDVITITSPQSARVFLDVWESCGKPKVNIATVGKGTSAVLIKRSLTPIYEAAKEATASVLAEELPTSYGMKVLYPTSSLAEKVLQENLEKRGFIVSSN
jgi:uroporphyrinogen-III synthase